VTLLDQSTWQGKAFSGGWTEPAGGQAAVIEPATGTELGRVGIASPADIAAAVREAGGPELDRRRIEVRDPIKTLGSHQVRVRLHPDVSAAVDIEITAS